MITGFIHSYDSCVGRLPSGHRIWKCQTTDGVHYAVADDSGMLPHTTDDGPLFLDCSRCLTTGVFTRSVRTHAGSYIAIPVFDEHGLRFSIPGDAASLLFLSKFLNWTIEDPTNELFYNVADAKQSGPPPLSPIQTAKWSYPYERTN